MYTFYPHFPACLLQLYPFLSYSRIYITTLRNKNDIIKGSTLNPLSFTNKDYSQYDSNKLLASHFITDCVTSMYKGPQLLYEALSHRSGITPQVPVLELIPERIFLR